VASGVPAGTIASIGRRGGEDLALVYLQLALYLEPNHGMALLSLADLYETLKKPDLAIKIYERVPASSPLQRSAQIQSAIDLDALDYSAIDVSTAPAPNLHAPSAPGLIACDLLTAVRAHADLVARACRLLARRHRAQLDDRAVDHARSGGVPARPAGRRGPCDRRRG